MAEAEDSLYYMRARYYDPVVGRFISEDPLGFGGGDVNLYAYVQNNPVNKIDPRGLQTGAETGVIGGVVGGTAGVGAAAAGAGAGVGIGIILYPSSIAEEPVIPAPLRRDTIPDSNPDAAKPDEGVAEPWPAADDNRGFCIQMYVMCQNQGWTGNCQACMDRCTGSGNGNWPFRGPGGCHPRKKVCK